MSDTKGWYAVDLDGTLAVYDGWKGVDHIGEPIPLMVARVKDWLAEGRDVRIFTARVTVATEGGAMRSACEADDAREAIQRWCFQHLGQRLPVTNTKDFGMVELWDDRCVQVVPNTGERMEDYAFQRGFARGVEEGPYRLDA